MLSRIIRTGLLLSVAVFAGCLPGSRSIPFPPEVSVDTPSGIQSGDVVFLCRLVQVEERPCDLQVEYKGGYTQDVWRPATVIGSRHALVPGEDILLTWASATDEPQGVSSDYQLRVRALFPANPFSEDEPAVCMYSEWAQTEAFTVNNGLASNTPPLIPFSEAEAATGRAVLSFDLVDSDGNPCEVEVEYRGGSTGKDWVPASVEGPVAGFSPAAGHIVTWAAWRDEPGSSAEFYLRIRAHDGFQPGPHMAAGPVAISSPVSVWGWGAGCHGELGDGLLEDALQPVPASGLPPVQAVAAGAHHTLALDYEGNVWAWGCNEYGQLGNGHTANLITPVRIQGISNVVDIAAGSAHSAALRADGTVWCWGGNSRGQLGDGTTVERRVPVKTHGLAGIHSVAAGHFHTLAISSNGRLWAWGDNSSGQLGDWTNIRRTLPVHVYRMDDARAAAAGYAHSAALTSEGRVWCWGDNGGGRLGDGTLTDRCYPVRVPNMGFVKAVAAGDHHTLALKTSGEAWAWGRNQYGQLGDGTRSDRHIPVRVLYVHEAKSVSAGTWHSAAVMEDGSVGCWGRNNRGQLGSDSPACSEFARRVEGAGGAKEVFSISSRTIILR